MAAAHFFSNSKYKPIPAIRAKPAVRIWYEIELRINMAQNHGDCQKGLSPLRHLTKQDSVATEKNKKGISDIRMVEDLSKCALSKVSAKATHANV